MSSVDLGAKFIEIAGMSPVLAIRIAAEAAMFEVDRAEAGCVNDSSSSVAGELVNAILDTERWARGLKTGDLRAIQRRVWGGFNDGAFAHAVATTGDCVTSAVIVRDGRSLAHALAEELDLSVFDDTGVFRTLKNQKLAEHLYTNGWLVDNSSWRTVLSPSSGPVLSVPQFPYTHGPLRIRWPRLRRETCWTLSELRSWRKSRALHEVLVAIDAASEGVVLSTRS